MKIKMFVLGVLSIFGWALSSSGASAFFLLPHCFHRNYSVIICRPYNAFTPMCYGNVVCDGCCPSPYCGGGGCQPPIQHCLPPIYNSGCCDTGCLPSGPYAAAGPALMLPAPPATQSPAPMQNTPDFTPPP